MFISSASAYQTPLARVPTLESTPLRNPFLQYSRDKIACEELLREAYREEGFPATIVRPSQPTGRAEPAGPAIRCCAEFGQHGYDEDQAREGAAGSAGRTESTSDSR